VNELLNEGLTPPDVTLCPERFYLDGDTCYPNPTDSNFIPEDKPDDLVRFEEKLEEYKDKPPTRYDDLDEYFKLQILDKCLQGLENTRGIQGIREFYTSGFDEDTTIPKATEASPLDIAIQECLAQLNHLEPLLGRGRATLEGEFLSAQDFFGSIQPYHADKANSSIESYWSVIPTHESDSLDFRKDAGAQNYIKREAITAQELMCESEFVTLKYKIQQGCQDITVYHNGEASVYNQGFTGNERPNDTGIGKGETDRINTITYVINWTEEAQIEKIQADIDKAKALQMFHFNVANLGIKNPPPQLNQNLQLPIEGWDMVPESQRSQELKDCYNSNQSNEFVCGANK